MEVRGPGGIIGKGQTHYSSDEILEAKGKRSDQLPGAKQVEVIHRNDWVNLFDEGKTNE